MIVLATLLAMQPAALLEVPNDIVVTGRRTEQLKRLRMTTRIDRKSGVTRCVFKRRSGDTALDDAVCNAVLACVPKVKTVKEMHECVAPTMDRLVGPEGAAQGEQWQAKAADGRR